MKRGSGKKVVLAMSGGVDSSVAAVLLREEGYEVVGCFMRLGSPTETPDDAEAAVDDGGDHAAGSGGTCAAPGSSRGQCSAPAGRVPLPQVKAHHQGCCSVNDASDARLVAALLEVPFYVLNFRRDFGRIMDYFVGEYNAGRTPNPCVRCNDWLKFGKLADYAKAIEADYIASGHYARVERDGAGPPRLLRGVDGHKDQSYVLFGMGRERLERLLLPIGGYCKTEIRQIAQEHHLPVFDKPDSQEICFVPDNDYAGLIRRRTPQQVQPGRIVDSAGNDLGEHPGHQHFTLGQRRGLSVAVGHPLYVLAKDPASNTVTVGTQEQLGSATLEANQCNWLIADPPRQQRACQVKIRSNGAPVPALVQADPEHDRLTVWFTQPQAAVTPGQAVVCYDGDHLLGGGWIERST